MLKSHEPGNPARVWRGGRDESAYRLRLGDLAVSRETDLAEHNDRYQDARDEDPREQPAVVSGAGDRTESGADERTPDGPKPEEARSNPGQHRDGGTH